MNIYRIDIEQPDGSHRALTDILGPQLIRSRQQANAKARRAAATMGRGAMLTRISGAGTVRVMGTFMPSGDFRKSGAIL